MTTPDWPTQQRSSPTKGHTCAAFLLRAAEYFGTHGISQIKRVMTDNLFSYRRSNDVSDAIAVLGAKHKFIKPHCPRQNGKVERFNPNAADRVGIPPARQTQEAERCGVVECCRARARVQGRLLALRGLPPISPGALHEPRWHI